jgi:hypothetical protein
MNTSDRVELDELLSVKLPAFETPKRTTEMLAVTAAAYPKTSFIGARDIRNNSKVYYISSMLEKCAANTTDKQFLQMAGTYFDNLDPNELAPPQYKSLKSKAESMEATINYYDEQLESLDRQIQQSERTLNEYSSVSINQHNALVDKYNDLLISQRKRIDDYNVIINRINSMNLVRDCITSVGGGINLRPKEFRRITRAKNAPKIKEISSLKGQIKTVGKIARAGNWIKSRVGKGGARVNAIPIESWILEKAQDGSSVYRYASGKSDRLSFRSSATAGDWRSEASINGTKDVIQISDGGSAIQVVHLGTNISGKSTVSKNTQRVVFSR